MSETNEIMYKGIVGEKTTDLGVNLPKVIKSLRKMTETTIDIIKVVDHTGASQVIDQKRDRLELIAELEETIASPKVFQQMRTDLLKYFAVSKLRGFMITAVFEDDGITGQTIIHPEDIEPHDARQLYSGAVNQAQMFGQQLVNDKILEPADTGNIIMPGDKNFNMNMQDVKIVTK